VPKENVLGQFGAGFLTFMKSLDIGRASLGAACLGGAQAALEGWHGVDHGPEAVRCAGRHQAVGLLYDRRHGLPKSRHCAR